MSDAWHHYEEGWNLEWFLSLLLVVVCVVALVRLRGRISKVEVGLYATVAIATVFMHIALAPWALALLFAGFPDALGGVVIAAPVVIPALVLVLLVRRARREKATPDAHE